MTAKGSRRSTLDAKIQSQLRGDASPAACQPINLHRRSLLVGNNGIEGVPSESKESKTKKAIHHFFDPQRICDFTEKTAFFTEKKRKKIKIFFRSKKYYARVSESKTSAANGTDQENGTSFDQMAGAIWRPVTLEFFSYEAVSQFVSLNFLLVFELLMSRFRYSSSCALFGTEETPEQLRLGDTVRPIAETRDATHGRDARCDPWQRREMRPIAETRNDNKSTDTTPAA